MSKKKDIVELLKRVRAQGCRVRETKNGHFQILVPDGTGSVTIAGTPSDHRAHKNNVARLRRMGVEA